MLLFQVYFIVSHPLTIVYRLISKVLMSLLNVDLENNGMEEIWEKFLSFIAPRIYNMKRNWERCIHFQVNILESKIVISQNFSNPKRLILGMIRPISSWRTHIPTNFDQVFRSVIVLALPAILVAFYQAQLFHYELQRALYFELDECDRLF